MIALARMAMALFHQESLTRRLSIRYQAAMVVATQVQVPVAMLGVMALVVLADLLHLDHLRRFGAAPLGWTALQQAAVPVRVNPALPYQTVRVALKTGG